METKFYLYTRSTPVDQKKFHSKYRCR